MNMDFRVHFGATNFRIHFGAVAGPIQEQLAAQGFTLPNVVALQEDVTAVSRLHIRGILPDYAAHAARKKLMHQITTQMVPVIKIAIGGECRNRKTKRLAKIISVTEDGVAVCHANGRVSAKTWTQFAREFEDV